MVRTVPQLSGAPRKTTRFTPRQLSWAAVLFEAAQSDKVVKSIEIDHIVEILSNEFKLDKSEALSLCERHSRDTRRSSARTIMAEATRNLKSAEKVKIEAAVRKVVESDGQVLPEEEVFMAVTNLSLKI